MFVDWEVRVSIEGRPLYYDHVNQRVSLDRPEASADGRGAATPTDNAPLGSLQNFLVRFVLGESGCGQVLGREMGSKKGWVGSHTLSGLTD